MKKLFFTFLIVFILLSMKGIVFAQEPSTQAATIVLTPTPSPIIEYFLPYPGILPNNPLYSLKAMRDKFISLLISDLLKKASFDLLQADKRLSMAVFLLKESKNNAQLALSTISKGQNYFSEAIDKTEEAKKQGMDINEIVSKLGRASLKHKEVLVQLRKSIPDSTKNNLDEVTKRMDDIIKKVNTLKPKKID